MIFASRLKPRNLCTREHYWDSFAYELGGFFSSWPLENVSYHFQLLDLSPLILNVPHHYVFGKESDLHAEYVVCPYPSNQAVGIQTITYRNRPIPFFLQFPHETRIIPSDYFNVAVKSLEKEGPGGVRYRFPADVRCLNCPLCVLEL